LTYWSKSSGGYWWLEHRLSSYRPHCVFQFAKGKVQRRHIEPILGRVQRYGKQKAAATMKIQITDEENIFPEVVKHATRPRQSFRGFILGVIQNPAGRSPVRPALGDLALSRWLDQMISTGAFQPELSHKSTYLVGRSQKAGQRSPRKIPHSTKGQD